MKQFILLLLFTIISVCNISAQTLPPEAGNYYCYTTGLANDPSASNPIQVIPAFFGDIVFDGKGNYRLTQQNHTGKYILAQTGSKLTFTGDLSVMTVSSYHPKGFILSYKGYGFNCNLRGAKGNAGSNGASNSPLNEGMTGKILTTSSNQPNAFLGQVFEFDLAKGTYTQIFPDGVAAQNPEGEIFYFDKTSRMKITDRSGNTVIKQLSDKINYNFDDFYPSISNSGEYIAFTFPYRSNSGSIGDLVSNGVKLVIADRNGKGIAEFRGFTQAAWMPDGRLVVAGDGKTKQGLFVVDAKFKNISPLFEGSNLENATMPAISADGKRVAFAKNGEIWAVNLDGTNRQNILRGSTSSFPAWSPDGKYIATSTIMKVNFMNKSVLVVVDLKADKAFTVTNGNGEPVETKNRITWLQ